MTERHLPNADGPGRVYGWSWGPDEQRRPGLPWIGVFLIVFGALLLIERALPDYQRLGDVAVLAAGVASLLYWLFRRGTIALYAGAFLSALALPGTIQALGQPLGPGWGMFFFGLAFLFVALVRATRGGGVGWQALYGGILVVIALTEIVKPDLAGIAWPLVLVGIGLVLLIRGTGRA
ncbi:MAG TPA: hypothetical protein VGO64_09160 [Candidatus Limnocylindrales bacterium]|nr:hypothetical protein [Candidatus Limnocylindrales bacterium]